jgi:glycosyltransferase involved in cell wall biosynthesis
MSERSSAPNPGDSVRLSAVLAVKNEEEMLEGALRSLDFCDEIVVVVDDRTTDRTEEIARRFADQVLVRPFLDFAQIRNDGIALSRGQWVLHVDADERITPELARQIRAALDDGDTDVVAFRAPTINFFWGQRMDHGGWGPEMFQIRLLRRDYARFDRRVHETVDVPPDRVRTLTGERWHLSHRSIEEGLRKALLYGRLEASDRLERGEPPVRLRTFVRVMGLEFGRRMVRRRGYRDGMPGIIEAIFQPFALFCAQVMLWELQQGDAIRRRYEELESRLAEEI